MKVGQNIWLNKTSDQFENGSFLVKNKVIRSNLRKQFLYAQEATFLVGFSINLVRILHQLNLRKVPYALEVTFTFRYS